MAIRPHPLHLGMYTDCMAIRPHPFHLGMYTDCNMAIRPHPLPQGMHVDTGIAISSMGIHIMTLFLNLHLRRTPLPQQTTFCPRMEGAVLRTLVNADMRGSLAATHSGGPSRGTFTANESEAMAATSQSESVIQAEFNAQLSQKEKDYAEVAEAMIIPIPHHQTCCRMNILFVCSYKCL